MPTISTASPPTATGNRCATCGESATLRCSKCHEGVDKHGQAGPTHYCSAACQSKHWPTHKIECKLKLNRQRLWRAAELLRDLTYVHAEVTWYHHISITSQSDSSIRLEFPNTDTHDFSYTAFPGNGLSARDRCAILCLVAEDGHGIQMAEALRSVLTGVAVSVSEVMVRPRIASRAAFYFFGAHVPSPGTINHSPHKLYRATISNGEEFALAPTIAKYGGDKVVLPWSDFVHQYSDILTDVRPLGYYCTKMDSELASLLVLASSNPVFHSDAWAWVMHFAHRGCVKISIEAALTDDRKLGELVGLPSEEYNRVKGRFLARFRAELVAAIGRIKAHGGIGAVMAKTLAYGDLVLP